MKFSGWTMRIKFAWILLAVYVLLVGRALMHAQTVTQNASGISNVTNLTTPAIVGSPSTHDLYGYILTNGAASTCYAEFIAGQNPVLGQNVAFSIPVAATSTIVATPTGMKWGTFGGGLAVGLATTSGGNTACGSAGSAVVFYE